MELICGACQGRLLVETPGSTVACPHCGTLLQTPGEAGQDSRAAFFPGPDNGPANGPDPGADTVRLDPSELPGLPSPGTPFAETFRDRSGASASEVSEGTSASPSSVELDEVPPQGVPVIQVTETGSVVVTSAAEGLPSGGDTAQPPGSSVTCLALGIGIAEGGRAAEHREGVSFAEASPTAVIAEISREPDSGSAATAGSPVSDAPAAGVEQGALPVARPGAAESGGRTSPEGVSPLLFKMVLSYASAVTIACAYLIWTRPSTLNLPDLAPPKSKDKSTTRMKYLRPEFELPPANVLKLGESRQFGSVRVTPLRVTRGLIEFAYYRPEDVAETRDPDGPVLKLHLRFENVSPDQEFAPLDDRLVFTKASDGEEYGIFKANNFVCNVGDRAQRAKHVFVYDMYADGSWSIKDQHLNRELGPGQTVETFIATTKEQIETLAGELVWRVHFRKGYNRDSYRGVTTLIEVRFRSSEIVDEELPKEVPGTNEA